MWIEACILKQSSEVPQPLYIGSAKFHLGHCFTVEYMIVGWNQRPRCAMVAGRS